MPWLYGGIKLTPTLFTDGILENQCTVAIEPMTAGTLSN